MKNAIRTFSEKIMVMIAAVALATFSYGAPPANDNFAKAMTISGTEGIQTGNTIDATLEASEPYAEAAEEMGGADVRTVWYKWTAPAGVNKVAFYVSYYSTGYAWLLYGVFEGKTLDSLSSASKSSYGRDFAVDDYYAYSFGTYDVTPGQTYYVCVVSVYGAADFRLGWKAANGFSTVVDDGILLGYMGECPQVLAIPNTVTWIAESAFDWYDDESCENLETVVFPESVAGIGYRAFCNCNNLTYLTFNKGMYAIEDDAFSECDSLAGKTITLPWFLQKATGDAFSGIYNSNVTVGEGGDTHSQLTINAPMAVKDTFYSGYYGVGYRTELVVKYFEYSVNNLVNVVLYPEGGEFSRGVRLVAAGQLQDDGSTIVAVWKNKPDWNSAISRKPTKAGYVFDGFWTEASGGKQIWDADMKYVSGTGYWSTDGKWTGSALFGMDAYAHWKKSSTGTYTVKYHKNDPNGGADVTRDQSFTEGETKRLLYLDSALKWAIKDEDGFSYIFLGWAKSPTGAAVYENGEQVCDLVAKGKVMHLYAVWQKRAYQVVFHSNDGANKTVSQEFRPGIAKNLLWLDSGLKWTRSGYDFLGWAKSPTSTAVVYTNGQKVNNLVAMGEVLHLYAVWRDRRWTIRFHRNYYSGDGEYKDQKIPVGASVKLLWLDSQLGWTRNGYWFRGWAKSRTAGAAYQNGQTVKDLVPGGQVLHIYGAWGQKNK